MIRHKIKEWVNRYLPAEIAGTISAVGTAGITHLFYKNPVLIAYAGSIGESVGFYSTVFIQHTWLINKKNKAAQKLYSYSDLFRTISTIVSEFGPAGLIDGLLLRPFFMFIFPLFLNSFLTGILIGKIAGDLTFYLLVIISYELSHHKKTNSKLKR